MVSRTTRNRFSPAANERVRPASDFTRRQRADAHSKRQADRHEFRVQHLSRASDEFHPYGDEHTIATARGEMYGYLRAAPGGCVNATQKPAVKLQPLDFTQGLVRQIDPVDLDVINPWWRDVDPVHQGARHCRFVERP